MVAKKDGKSLRLVHSLEPLNAVTIAHSGVPPATEELAAKFGGHACGGMFDLYVGYDECLLAEESRDMTTFHWCCTIPTACDTSHQMCDTCDPPKYLRHGISACYNNK